MGNLADIYKKKVMEGVEVNKIVQPDRVTDPQGYFEYNKQKRYAARSVKLAREYLGALRLPLNQLMDAYGTVMGSNEAERVLNNTKTSLTYRTRMLLFLEREHPELLQELGNNVEKFRDKYVFFDETVERWIEEGKLTRAEAEVPLAAQVIQSFYSIDPAEEMAIITVLEQTMDPQKAQTLTERLATIKSIDEYTPNEMTEGTHDARIDELSANIPQNIADDPAKSEKYQRALAYAKEHLNVMKPEIRDEYWSREKTCQSIEAGRSNVINSMIPDYENGKYHNIYDENESKNGIIVVDHERENDLDALLNTPVEYSEETKEGLRLIYAKMEEMKLHEYPYNPQGEDGAKIYSFNKLLDQKNALIAAVEAGNPDDIIKASEDYEKTVNDMKELYALAKKYLNADPLMIPGNMDSIRNNELPFEFTGDIKTTAMINGAFITFTRIKQSGVKVDDYINDPTGTIVRANLENLKNVSFTEQTKNLELEELISVMTSSGKHANGFNRVDNAVPLMGFGRQIALPTMLEKDAELFQKNAIGSEAMFSNLQLAVVSERSKYKFLQGDPSSASEEDRWLRSQTLQKLIVASDAERNPAAILGNLPQTDYLGRKVGETFDLEEALNRNPIDYAGMIDRAERMMRMALYAPVGVDKSLYPDEVLESIQKVYIEVLVRHPQDQQTPGFERMKNELKLLPERLSESASAELKEKVASLNESYFANNAPELEKNPGWENAAYASGFMIDNFFTSFAGALNDTPFYNSIQDRVFELDELINEYGQNEDNPKIIENPRYDRQEGYVNSPHLNSENPDIKFSRPIKGREAENIYKTAKRELLDRIKREISNAKEEKAKRRWEDMAYILTEDEVKLATFYSTSPYGSRMEAMKMDLLYLKGNGFEAGDVKKELGSFYDDQLDLMHFATEELRVGIERQKKEEELKRNGKSWSKADEEEYADKIRAAHTGYITAYEKLRQVTDPTLLKTDKQQPNGFESIMDRVNQRGVTSAYGWVKGELKALENGWSTKDMAVLGAFGGVEAAIESIREFGDDARKQGIEDYARDFKALKDKYWNKHIESNADKKEICDGLLALAEKYSDKPFNAVLNSSYKSLLRIGNDINKEAAKTELADNEMRHKKDKEPVEYLKDLEAAGDMKKFVAALVEISDLREGNILSEENAHKFDEYYNNHLLGLTEDNQPVVGWDFLERYHKAAMDYLNEQSIEYVRQSEIVARDIRDGRHEYSEALGDLGKDYKASEEIATTLVSNHRVGEVLASVRQIVTRVEMEFEGKRKDGKPWDPEAHRNWCRNEYAKKATDGLTEKERNRMIAKAVGGVVPTKSKYGVKIEKNVLTIHDKALLESKAQQNSRKAVNSSITYMTAVMNDVGLCSEKFERLKELKAYKNDNSKEFMAMYDALEEVTRINEHNTPDQVEALFEKLETASKAYFTAKRVNSKFAGRHGNGLERAEFANELGDFAASCKNSYVEKHTDQIVGTKGMAAQIAYNTNVATVVAAKQQAPANNVQNNVPNNAPVNENANVNVQNNVQNNGPVNENANVNVQNNAQNNVPVNENAGANDNHRKMDVKEVRKMLKEGKAAPQGRKSVGSAPKNEEMKNNAAPGAKDSRKSIL